mgnify:CR=1 FL=1
MGSINKDMPLQMVISFDKLLQQYDKMAKSDDMLLSSRAKFILETQAPFPELRDGFSDIKLLEKYKKNNKVFFVAPCVLKWKKAEHNL